MHLAHPRTSRDDRRSSPEISRRSAIPRPPYTYSVSDRYLRWPRAWRSHRIRPAPDLPLPAARRGRHALITQGAADHRITSGRNPRRRRARRRRHRGPGGGAPEKPTPSPSPTRSSSPTPTLITSNFACTNGARSAPATWACRSRPGCTGPAVPPAPRISVQRQQLPHERGQRQPATRTPAGRTVQHQLLDHLGHPHPGRDVRLHRAGHALEQQRRRDCRAIRDPAAHHHHRHRSPGPALHKGADWNGHTSTLGIEGYDANISALWSVSVTSTGRVLIANQPKRTTYPIDGTVIVQTHTGYPAPSTGATSP